MYEVLLANGARIPVGKLQDIPGFAGVTKEEVEHALQGTGWVRRDGRLICHIREEKKNMDGRLIVTDTTGGVQHFNDVAEVCQAFPVQPYMVRRALKDNWDEPDAGWIYTDTSNGEVIDYFIDIEAGSEQQLELF